MIVIPMAGQSSRFFEVGYSVPKHMLQLKGHSVFYHALNSFRYCFNAIPFLFIARDIYNTSEFLVAECKKLGIKNCGYVLLRNHTRGQAETVLNGLSQVGTSDEMPLTIFNIDTFRPNFRFPTDKSIKEADGFLEVFRGSGDNWSYVRPQSKGSTKIVEVAEKRCISNLCCTGLYHFKRTSDFRDSFNASSSPRSQAELKEKYVAPLYNHLIERGLSVHYQLIDRREVVFCGTPSEYENLI